MWCWCVFEEVFPLMCALPCGFPNAHNIFGDGLMEIYVHIYLSNDAYSLLSLLLLLFDRIREEFRFGFGCE